MHGLEKSVTAIANHEMNKKSRDRAIELLNGMISDLNAGIGIWKDYQKAAGKKATAKGLYGGWAGSDVEKQLFDLNLTTRAKSVQVSGGQSGLDEPLIELAYRKLDEDETGADAAAKAIETMGTRSKSIEKLIGLIRNTTPKKLPTAKAPGKSAPAAKSGAKKAAAKKPAAKKTAPSTKKPAAKAKPAAKKKAAKKSAAKKAVAKKAAPKKAAPKKAAPKKKAAAKKPAAKKPADKAKKSAVKKKAGAKKKK